MLASEPGRRERTANVTGEVVAPDILSNVSAMFNEAAVACGHDGNWAHLFASFSAGAREQSRYLHDIWAMTEEQQNLITLANEACAALQLSFGPCIHVHAIVCDIRSTGANTSVVDNNRQPKGFREKLAIIHSPTLLSLGAVSRKLGSLRDGAVGASRLMPLARAFTSRAVRSLSAVHAVLDSSLTVTLDAGSEARAVVSDALSSPPILTHAPIDASVEGGGCATTGARVEGGGRATTLPTSLATDSVPSWHTENSLKRRAATGDLEPTEVQLHPDLADVSEGVAKQR